MSYTSAVLFLICSVGCASSLQRSVEAYERGDFREAHELLARVDPSEGQEHREAVDGGIDYSASYLLSQAWVALERSRGAKPYREALAYYRAALTVMPEDHPRRTETLSRVAEVEREMAEVRERHRTALARFREVALARDYTRAIDMLGALIELVRSVGADEPEAAEALALAEGAMGEGRHEDAVRLVELADILRREANAQVDAEMGEIARVAAALRYFRRLEEEEGGRRSTARRKESKPSRLGSADAGEETVIEREARGHLARARRQWAAGKKYDALRTLDDAIAMLGSGFDLGDQRARWQPARELLIADYVDRGELALSREASAEARGWYERILALDPDHELARDRMRKLDKLQELQSDDR